MASSSQHSHNAIIIKSSVKRDTHPQSFRVRAQSFGDEGRLNNNNSNNVVDANMSVLRERIKKVEMKERLERSCRCKYGWNYESGFDYNYRHKQKDKKLSEFLELVGLVGGTVGFTCLSGTVFLCIFSILVHLNL